MHRSLFLSALRQRTILAALLTGFSIFSSAPASAAVLVGWDTSSQTGGSGNFGTTPLAASQTAAHITSGGLVRGAGVGTSGTGAARGWGGNAWTSGSAAAAAAAGSEVSCTLAIEAGYSASFSSISRFDYRRSASGATSGVLQYRIGSGTFTDIMSLSYTSTASSGASLGAISLANIPALQNVSGGTSVTFRIINYGGSSSSGTWYIYDVAGSSASDLEIEGTVSQTTNTSLAASFGAADVNLVPGGSAALAVLVVPANQPASTGVTVTADLSSLGGPSSLPLTMTSANNYAATYTLSASASPGSASIPVSVRDDQNRVVSLTLNVTVRGDLNIVHINDTHTRVPSHQWVVPAHGINLSPQFEEVGGVAVLTGKMLSVVAAKPTSLVLDGGDISEGNPLGDWDGPGHPIGSFGNAVMVDFYKLLAQKLRTIPGRQGRGLDAMVVGNHDIRSINYINNLKNQTDFPVISANICVNGTKTPYFAAYQIVEVNGNKVGILGYTTESADSSDPTVNAAIDVVKCDWWSTDSTKIHFADYVNELRNVHGCNLVILLTHMGHSGLCTPTFSNPTPILVDDQNAKVPEIAVTGHWHTYCDTVWQPAALNYKTIFTESGSYTHFVGELLVNGLGRYKSSLYHPLRHSEIAPDPDMLAYVNTRKAQFSAAAPTHDLYQVIGYTADDLLLDNDLKWWSTNEYPWSGNHTAGNWICDAVQWKARQLFGACDLAIESGGGVRSDIPAGPVTYMQIYETFPWADDLIWRVNMTGQEIWNYIREHGCSVGLSAGWHVTAYDGVPTSITLNGQPLDLGRTYTVAINNYMYNHDTVPFSDPVPLQSSLLSRDAIIEYTGQFSAANPYQCGPSRYSLNTEFAGGYRGVITMMNDADSKTAFEVGFIRLLEANSETLARRGSRSVPLDLVRADGSVRRSNRLGENELYRSYLGFKEGVLQPGDIVEVWGKGAFYEGNPEFVDQEGIQSDGVEFKIVGHDASLALPAFMPSIASFWNDEQENHYIRFFAKKTGASTVSDQEGTSIPVYDKTGYTLRTLPGSVGDLLVISGVPTSENYSLRLRSDAVALASTVGVTQPPPSSSLIAVPEEQTATSLVFQASAAVAPGAGTSTYTLLPAADSQVARGRPTSNFGTSTSGYVQSQSSTDSAAFLDERIWYKFDLSSLPTGSPLLSAVLKNYCWKATGASLPATLHAGLSDTWTETALTWNNQPALGAALSTQTLAASSTNVWYSWDVTAHVVSELAGDKVASLVLKASAEGSTDTTPPSYSFDNKEYTSAQPYLEVKVSNGAAVPTVSSIELFGRYSADGTTWSTWTTVGVDSSAPWSFTYSFAHGDGFYEFYTRATDSNGTVEPAPAFADQRIHRSTTAAASIALTNTSATYDGQAHAPTVVTDPAGLEVALSYNGSATIPVQAGTYQVVATVTSPGYTGAASGTFTINQATQTLTLSLPANPAVGSQFNLTASASSGLPVTFVSSNPSVLSISGGIATVNGLGTSQITAEQVGNANYLPASTTQTFSTDGSGSGAGGGNGSDGADIPVLPWWAILGALGAFAALFQRRRKCL